MGQLSPLSWVIFFSLAIVMGLNNIYSTLLTGWGDGGSIVAVILCLLFLSAKQRTIVNYNLGQTIASAGGSVGFSVAMIASISYLYQKRGLHWDPPLFDLSLLIMSFAIMGVSLASMFRKVIVNWLFPQAIACAMILRTVTSCDLQERRRARRIMSISGLLSTAITIPAKIALHPGGSAILSKISFTKSIMLSPDPLLYGIGIVIGGRIGFSILLGALINVLMIEPLLLSSSLDVGEYTRWIAVGLMALPAFTSALCAYLMKVKRAAPSGFSEIGSPLDDRFTIGQIAALSSLLLIALAITLYEMHNLFGASPYHVLFGALLSPLMCFALGKVASETGINPIRLLAIVLLFLFSLFENGQPATLLAIAVSGATYAAVAVDLFNDLRTGYLIRANPIDQIIMQFLGVIPTSFATVYFLSFLTENFRLGSGEYFPAPSAVVWATMGDAFSGSGAPLPSGALIAVSAATAVGVLLSILENFKGTQNYTPSAFALGIAVLIPFEMSAAIFCGSLIRSIAGAVGRSYGGEMEKRVQESAFQSGSAIFAASSIAGIMAILLISIGAAYLPNEG